MLALTTQNQRRRHPEGRAAVIQDPERHGAEIAALDPDFRQDDARLRMQSSHSLSVCAGGLRMQSSHSLSACAGGLRMQSSGEQPPRRSNLSQRAFARGAKTAPEMLDRSAYTPNPLGPALGKARRLRREGCFR